MRSQDVLVALDLALDPAAGRTLPLLSRRLGLSLSEVHGAVERGREAGLIGADRTVNRAALLELLVHGVKYVFPARRGGMTRGVPTAHAAKPLVDELASDGEPPPVWPDPDGSMRGLAFEPLYRSVPHAARNEPRLYEALCLVDAIRGGRARERALATEHLTRMLA